MWDAYDIRRPLPTQNGEYHLCAVSCHIGSTVDAGHYITYIRSASGWIRVNDDKVGTVNWDVTVSHLSRETPDVAPECRETPYILLYQKSASTEGTEQ